MGIAAGLIIAGIAILGVVMAGAGMASAASTSQTAVSSMAGSAAAGGASTSTSGGKPNAAGMVNPFGPGFATSRLDMGMDGTAKQFLAPFSGTVVASDPSNSGWQGGGYVAIKSDSPLGLASQTVYFAEGLTPAVSTGTHVTAGQQIATPRANPYNGIVGNIEWGLASDSSPEQPLAHVISNPAAMVLAFAKWAEGLGVPPPTSTGNAGFP